MSNSESINDDGRRGTLAQLISCAGPAIWPAQSPADDARQRLSARAQTLHDELASKAPRFVRTVNKQSFHYGVPALALYRALLADETLALDEASATAIVEAAVLDHAARRIARSPLLPLLRFGPLGRLMLERSMLKLREPHGWLARPVRGPARQGAKVAFDIYQCPLVGWLAELGAPGLRRVFCRCDALAAEAIGLRLRRAGTIAEGAPICDFRYDAPK